MNLINYLYKLSKGLLLLFLTSMVLLVIFQVINRNIIQLPFVWIDELSRFLFIWSSFLGASIALKDKELAAFDLLENKFNKTISQVHKIIIELLALTFILVALYYGLKLTFGPSVLGQESIALRLPMHYVYLSLPVSMFLMVIYTLQNLINLIRGVNK